MALKPIQQEPVQSACQVLLSLLSDERVNIPASMLEGVMSGKSLLRGVINGNLFICEKSAEPEPDDSPGPTG